MTFTNWREISDHYQLLGCALKTVPEDSPLMSPKHDLYIEPDPQLLKWVMSLADRNGNPIECYIKYGLSTIFWDNQKLCFGVYYSHGEIQEASSFKDVRRILTEAQRHNSYGDLGHDSDSPYDGDYDDDDTERDGQYK